MGKAGRLVARLKWYFLRPIQKLTRGWAYSDLWALDHHFAKFILPRLRDYSRAYSAGRFDGLCPGLVLLEYKDALVQEGFVWNESGYFEGPAAEKRIAEIWQGILDSMIRSFEWLAKGEPIPVEYYRPNPLHDPKAEMLVRGPEGYSTINPAYGEKNVDSEEFHAFRLQIENGFELFGRYFRCLGD